MEQHITLALEKKKQKQMTQIIVQKKNKIKRGTEILEK